MSTSVAGRIAALLGAFGPLHPTLTLSELARRADLPLSTAHRIGGELVRHGLLERDDQLRFRIGLRLWETVAGASRTVDLRETALPALQRLYELTRENVQLAVLDGSDAVYVERLAGPASVHVVTRAGSRLPLHASGVGLVLLANAPVEVQDTVLAGPLRRFTRFTITDPRRLRTMLADVRRDGFVISDRQIETISMSVAAPIRDERSRVVAAVSVVAAADTDARTLVDPVVRAARVISRRLGRAGGQSDGETPRPPGFRVSPS